ncbi:MAG: DUF1543 domain-containing protein [Wenzhouxiangella sp.]|jgi:hypothetical protein|nr:DUF1543 domain-containing protein [Wenzhouxiangella sp.]
MSETSKHLFAVLLGGRAPGCRVELHDVAFAVGESLETIHDTLLDQWFGEPHGLHVDAYCLVDQVEGYRIRLDPSPPNHPEQRLYFINIGGYRPGEFAEQHAYHLLAAPNKTEAKAKAKRQLLQGHTEVHKDDLYDVDDVLRIDSAGGVFVHLDPDPAACSPDIVNGYFPLPLKVVQAWIEKKA